MKKAIYNLPARRSTRYEGVSPEAHSAKVEGLAPESSPQLMLSLPEPANAADINR
jgi:hypothetical protein